MAGTSRQRVSAAVDASQREGRGTAAVNGTHAVGLARTILALPEQVELDGRRLGAPAVPLRTAAPPEELQVGWLRVEGQLEATKAGKPRRF